MLPLLQYLHPKTNIAPPRPHPPQSKSQSEMSHLSSNSSASSLPQKLQRFIELNSMTSAYIHRSHSRHSLLNAYMVCTFLSEASASVPPLKRNAGLRDLAQCLHLWPSDVAMELQRDALKAIELLEGYVKEVLKAELRYVERLNATSGSETSSTQFEELWRVRDAAVRDLEVLKGELRGMILRRDSDAAAGSSSEFEPHDLAPFIPGFTGRQTTSSRTTQTLRLSVQTKGSPILMDLLASGSSDS